MRFIYKKLIYWSRLSWNPSVIHLLASLNKKKMRENCKAFAEELAAYVFHPLRLMRICEAYGLELEEYFERAFTSLKI